MLRPNGEVAGPLGRADQTPWAHTDFRRTRRVTTGHSRTPPMIVRGRHGSPDQSVSHNRVNQKAWNKACYVHHKIRLRQGAPSAKPSTRTPEKTVEQESRYDGCEDQKANPPVVQHRSLR